MTHALRNLTLAALAALAAAGAWAAGNHAGGHDADDAIGRPGEAAKVTRTLNVDMNDAMRFVPADIGVGQGETVRLVVRNAGKLKHELVLGTGKTLKAHNEMMRKNPEMAHADPNMVTLAPGQTGEVVWQFTRAGKIDFACLQPGHYELGMKGIVNVAKAGSDAVAGDPAAMAELSEGEIRKVDPDAAKLTIRHGPIQNLDMPGMTMVFQVKDASMINRVQAGDKVRFRAEKIGGKLTVTEIETVR